MAQDLSIPALDGFKLAATWFAPKSNCDSVVIINSATAVRRGFYQAYACWLASRGFAVLTYDYRGIGGSRGQSSQARMQDWGELDFAGIIEWAREKYPAARLLCVGHSVGGQIVGLAPNGDRLSRVLGIAAQSGYWRHWKTRYWPRLLISWYLLGPILSRLVGNIPGALLGGEPLPGSIARQWAGWCRHSDYLFCDGDDERRRRFAAIRCPIAVWAIADDDAIAPLPAVQALAGFYSQAHVQLDVVNPRIYGAESLGHFGFFRKNVPESLWRESADWLVQI